MALLRQRVRDRPPNPPPSEGRKRRSSLRIEPFDRAQQPDRPFLYEIVEGETELAVARGDASNQRQVLLDEETSRCRIACAGAHDQLLVIDVRSTCPCRPALRRSSAHTAIVFPVNRRCIREF